MKKTMIVLFMWLIIMSLSAQTLSFKNYLNRTPFSFLSTNRLSMHHSVGFTAFSSNGKASYFTDYTNHLSYRLNSKLNFKVNLHFVNYGGANFNNGFSNTNYFNSKKVNVIPEFIMNYSPSENFHITIHYNGNNKQFGNYPNYIFNDFR